MDPRRQTRVHPYPDPNAVVPRRFRCPCSVDFKGEITCCKVFSFFISVVLIVVYFGCFVTGIVVFGGCKKYYPDFYMIVGGLVCTVPLVVFAAWICNRCFDAQSMVTCAVVSLFIIVVGSLVGIFVILLGDCDLLVKHLAACFSSPVWLFFLVLTLYWCYKNYMCIHHVVWLSGQYQRLTISYNQACDGYIV